MEEIKQLLETNSKLVPYLKTMIDNEEEMRKKIGGLQSAEDSWRQQEQGLLFNQKCLKDELEAEKNKREALEVKVTTLEAQLEGEAQEKMKFQGKLSNVVTYLMNDNDDDQSIRCLAIEEGKPGGKGQGGSLFNNSAPVKLERESYSNIHAIPGGVTIASVKTELPSTDDETPLPSIGTVVGGGGRRSKRLRSESSSGGGSGGGGAGKRKTDAGTGPKDAKKKKTNTKKPSNNNDKEKKGIKVKAGGTDDDEDDEKCSLFSSTDEDEEPGTHFGLL